MFTRLPALLLSLVALPVFAEVAPQLSEHDILTRIGDVKTAHGLAPKEINQGCGLVAPLPTTTTGATYTAEVNDVFLGQQFARFRMTAWRKDCPAGDKQLMLTLEPTAGSTQLSDLFTVRQGGRNFNTVLVMDAAGAIASRTLSAKTTYLVRFIGDANQTFDDDAAFTLSYLGLGSGASIDIPSVSGGVATPSIAMGDWFDGAYYYPSHHGQGFLLDVDASAGIVSGAWFTVDRTGKPAWYTFLGNSTGTRTAITLYRTDGVQLFQPANVTDVAVGTGEIVFQSCTTIRITFEAPPINAALNGLELTKLTRPDRDCRQ